MRSDVMPMAGKVFSYLTVISFAGKRRKYLMWNVRCVCGTEKEVEGAHLRDGRTRSCGCKKHELEYASKGHDLVGRVFGHLTAVERLNKRNSSGEFIWLCRCLCGLTKEAATGSLNRGLVRSCGSGDCRALLRKQVTGSTKRRERHLLTRYGLTESDVQHMDEAQEYRCRGCKKVKTLETDHCHKTNKVRGRLCGNCNRALGLADDNAATLRSLAIYVEETCQVAAS